MKLIGKTQCQTFPLNQIYERAVNPEENFKTSFFFAVFDKVIKTSKKNLCSRPKQLDNHNSNFGL